ncbi:MAG: cytochrome-c oxidase [Betaproteobacteria bacterium]
MGLHFLKIAVVYLAIGAGLGLYMGITVQFTLAPVHAHLLLLGWASLALAGIVYHLYPEAATTRLARIHFWLHNLALPVFMVGLGMLLSGRQAAMPIVAVGATTVLVGLILFASNVLLNVQPGTQRAT